MKVFAKAEKALDPTNAKTLWDKVVSLTPVMMTVVATILAGLSSSEMSTAQYHRAEAAQNQSKAGDQWSFYQAKRLREANTGDTLDLMQTIGSGGFVTPGSIAGELAQVEDQWTLVRGAAANRTSQPSTEPSQAAADGALSQFSKGESALYAKAGELIGRLRAALTNPAGREALHHLESSDLPPVVDQPIGIPSVQAALSAVNAGKSEADTVEIVRAVDDKSILKALAVSDANANAFDSATKPLVDAADRIGRLLGAQAALGRRYERDVQDPASPRDSPAFAALASSAASLRSAVEQLYADFTSARLRLVARRYEAESRYNLTTAQLYEVQVRRSSLESERHRDRSKQFFYGMLAAQAAVTISSLSLALKQRSLLWSLASAAGAAAVSLGVYVYLFT